MSEEVKNNNDIENADITEQEGTELSKLKKSGILFAVIAFVAIIVTIILFFLTQQHNQTQGQQEAFPIPPDDPKLPTEDDIKTLDAVPETSDLKGDMQPSDLRLASNDKDDTINPPITATVEYGKTDEQLKTEQQIATANDNGGIIKDAENENSQLIGSITAATKTGSISILREEKNYGTAKDAPELSMTDIKIVYTDATGHGITKTIPASDIVKFNEDISDGKYNDNGVERTIQQVTYKDPTTGDSISLTDLNQIKNHAQEYGNLVKIYDIDPLTGKVNITIDNPRSTIFIDPKTKEEYTLDEVAVKYSTTENGKTVTNIPDEFYIKIKSDDGTYHTITDSKNAGEVAKTLETYCDKTINNDSKMQETLVEIQQGGTINALDKLHDKSQETNAGIETYNTLIAKVKTTDSLKESYDQRQSIEKTINSQDYITSADTQKLQSLAEKAIDLKADKEAAAQLAAGFEKNDNLSNVRSMTVTGTSEAEIYIKDLQAEATKIDELNAKMQKGETISQSDLDALKNLHDKADQSQAALERHLELLEKSGGKLSDLDAKAVNFSNAVCEDKFYTIAQKYSAADAALTQNAKSFNAIAGNNETLKTAYQELKATNADTAASMSEQIRDTSISTDANADRILSNYNTKMDNYNTKENEYKLAWIERSINNGTASQELKDWYKNNITSGNISKADFGKIRVDIKSGKVTIDEVKTSFTASVNNTMKLIASQAKTSSTSTSTGTTDETSFTASVDNTMKLIASQAKTSSTSTTGTGTSTTGTGTSTTGTGTYTTGTGTSTTGNTLLSKAVEQVTKEIKVINNLDGTKTTIETNGTEITRTPEGRIVTITSKGLLSSLDDINGQKAITT